MTEPTPERLRADVIHDLEVWAAKHELEAAQIERTARAMVKPAEQRTRRELERRARDFDSIAHSLRGAKRALTRSPLGL